MFTRVILLVLLLTGFSGLTRAGAGCHSYAATRCWNNSRRRPCLKQFSWRRQRRPQPMRDLAATMAGSVLSSWVMASRRASERGLNASPISIRIEVVNRANEASGVARPEVYDWAAAIPKILKSSPFDAVVVMMGINDYRPIKVGELRFEPGTPEWSNAYKANMDAILASITGNGARVYWVTLPPMQSEEFETQMKMVSSLQRERIVTGGHALLDVRPALVTPEEPTCSATSMPTARRGACAPRTASSFHGRAMTILRRL